MHLLGVARTRQTQGSISEFISHLSSIHFIYTKLIIYSLSTLVLQAFKTFKVSYYSAPATVSNTLVLSGFQRRVNINATAVSDRVSL